MRKSEIRHFAEVIGRSVLETERGSIATFNDFPLAMLEEARAVRLRGGRIPATDYLRFFVARQLGIDAEDFCEDVLENGADPKTWRIADCVIGVVEAEREGIALTVGQYMSTLDGITGERWVRAHRTDAGDGKIPMSRPGPGTLIRETRYWSVLEMPNPNASIRRLVIDPACMVVLQITEPDLDVAIRRWMASAAAWWSNQYLLTHDSHATVEGVLAAYAEPVTPSADGLIAIRALVREAKSGDPRWPSQVGYIGTDEWYRP